MIIVLNIDHAKSFGKAKMSFFLIFIAGPDLHLPMALCEDVVETPMLGTAYAEPCS